MIETRGSSFMLLPKLKRRWFPLPVSFIPTYDPDLMKATHLFNLAKRKGRGSGGLFGTFSGV